MDTATPTPPSSATGAIRSSAPRGTSGRAGSASTTAGSVSPVPEIFPAWTLGELPGESLAAEACDQLHGEFRELRCG
ncbi:hypothetical protein [Streptomyces sp. NPDC050287]|uniref:hypothetical protein n=1 Tax=Streptomyces sp. NPDC050287 TaxID=3365608 RepID=UPI0037A914FB